jgi:hypothetical protein
LILPRATIAAKITNEKILISHVACESFLFTEAANSGWIFFFVGSADCRGLSLAVFIDKLLLSE